MRASVGRALALLGRMGLVVGPVEEVGVATYVVGAIARLAILAVVAFAVNEPGQSNSPASFDWGGVLATFGGLVVGWLVCWTLVMVAVAL